MNRYVCGRAVNTALVILGFLAAGCGRTGLDGSDLPVPNGRFSAVTNEYPAVVLVQIPGNGGICTGTFVSERAVITASHCAKSTGSYKIYSSFGTFTTSNRVTYGPGVVDDPNDLALLILDRDVADREAHQVYPFGNRARAGDNIRLVGFGCNNIESKSGAGTKRTGTNIIYSITEYIELMSPLSGGGNGGNQSGTVLNSDGQNGNGLVGMRRVGGPQNVAYTCFGDSGGPGLSEDQDGNVAVIALVHAGGEQGQYQVSEMVDMVNRNDNRNWVRQKNQSYNLGIEGI